ncbi:MAG: SDR family NAD(P)-dependent oxidoreductase [Caedimonadaceae bacterium]|nr:MAG: SDR family NAD(P)-dependent oxidoreductase [Caedimonadaceae bacterium]
MKTILITGASSGIGKHTALAFNKTGHQLILLSRRKDKLDSLTSELNVPTQVIAADVSNTMTLQAHIDALPESFRSIDVLVNNAGLAQGMDPAYSANFNDWQTMINTNITGLLASTHVVLPTMVKRNQGHIINVGSVAALYPYAGGNVYGATKSFVHQFSKNLRADLLGTNIKVTIIAPGVVKTDFFDVRFKGDKSQADAVFKGFKPLEPEDIARTIHWAVEQPEHVNINLIEVMPTRQAPSTITIKRDN